MTRCTGPINDAHYNVLLFSFFQFLCLFYKSVSVLNNPCHAEPGYTLHF